MAGVMHSCTTLQLRPSAKHNIRRLAFQTVSPTGHSMESHSSVFDLSASCDASSDALAC